MPLQDLRPSGTRFRLDLRPLRAVCLKDDTSHFGLFSRMLQWGKGSATTTGPKMQWDREEVACTHLYRRKTSLPFLTLQFYYLGQHGIIMLTVLPYNTPKYPHMVIWDFFPPVWSTFLAFCSHERLGIVAYICRYSVVVFSVPRAHCSDTVNYMKLLCLHPLCL